MMYLEWKCAKKLQLEQFTIYVFMEDGWRTQNRIKQMFLSANIYWVFCATFCGLVANLGLLNWDRLGNEKQQHKSNKERTHWVQNYKGTYILL